MTDCYTAALRILDYRFNSEQELRRKLRAKKFDAETIDATIQRLHDEHWLDDDRYAGAFTRTRARKGVGKLRILRELHAAGVSDDAARRAVSENVDEDAERERLRALCDKRARLLIRRHGSGFLDTEEGRKKLAGYLLNQGYDARLVYETVKEISVVHHQSDS